MPKDTGDTFPGAGVPGVGERVLTNLAHSSRLLSSCTQSNSLEDLGYSPGYGKQDCLKLIRELNRELSTYHTILLSLNLHNDCDKVHEDLKRSRRKALDVVQVLKVKLPSRGLRLNQDHHMEVEKLWSLFVSCLDSLYLEMNRTLTLQEMLMMHSDGNYGSALQKVDSIKRGSCNETVNWWFILTAPSIPTFFTLLAAKDFLFVRIGTMNQGLE